MGISKMPPFCLDRHYIQRSTILVTVLPTGNGSKTTHLLFRDIVLKENHYTQTLCYQKKHYICKKMEGFTL